MCFYSLKDIVATRNQKSILLNLRVQNNTHYLYLTVNYNDGNEDFLSLSSFKTATYKFHDFNSIKISAKDVEFCLNFQLLTYTIPKIQARDQVDVTGAPFEISKTHLATQTYKDSSNIDRSFLESSSEVMLIFAAIILGLVLAFLIVVAVFRSPSPASNIENSDDTVETTANEVNMNDVGVTIEVTSLEQSIPHFYGVQPNPAFIRQVSRESYIISETDNEGKKKEVDIHIEVTPPEQSMPEFYGPHSSNVFMRQKSTESVMSEGGTKRQKEKKEIELTTPEHVVPHFYGVHSNPAFIRQESRESYVSSERELGSDHSNKKNKKIVIEVTTPEQVIPYFFGVHSNPAFIRQESRESYISSELGVDSKKRSSEPGTSRGVQ